MERRFLQVDVFGSGPYYGNPVAVVLDGSGLDDAEMSRFARWTNLSETTFLLPPARPEADYRVRIFTPAGELPFAGHPTLGSAHAWLARSSPASGRNVFVQECPAGLIRLRLADRRLSFAAPPLVRYEPVDEPTVAHLADLLGVDRVEIRAAQWVDNGPGWVAVLLASAEEVLRLRPRPEEGLSLGVVGPHPEGSEAAIEVRAFFSSGGVTFEDPVTGSLNASLAQWLLDTGRVGAPYTASQGAALGRRGRVFIERDDDGTIWVGGDTFTCVEGTVDL
ncbi:MAG TPA: PhzF family phenazine biosynthesis protein [Acidimicrobiales bacterium]|nr:PhzF family phenazine biosynthesis protein [Acidimicrobiales bacterium]